MNTCFLQGSKYVVPFSRMEAEEKTNECGKRSNLYNSNSDGSLSPQGSPTRAESFRSRNHTQRLPAHGHRSLPVWRLFEQHRYRDTFDGVSGTCIPIEKKSSDISIALSGSQVSPPDALIRSCSSWSDSCLLTKYHMMSCKSDSRHSKKIASFIKQGRAPSLEDYSCTAIPLKISKKMVATSDCTSESTIGSECKVLWNRPDGPLCNLKDIGSRYFTKCPEPTDSLGGLIQEYCYSKKAILSDDNDVHCTNCPNMKWLGGSDCAANDGLFLDSKNTSNTQLQHNTQVLMPDEAFGVVELSYSDYNETDPSYPVLSSSDSTISESSDDEFEVKFNAIGNIFSLFEDVMPDPVVRKVDQSFSKEHDNYWTENVSDETSNIGKDAQRKILCNFMAYLIRPLEVNVEKFQMHVSTTSPRPVKNINEASTCWQSHSDRINHDMFRPWKYRRSSTTEITGLKHTKNTPPKKRRTRHKESMYERQQYFHPPDETRVYMSGMNDAFQANHIQLQRSKSILRQTKLCNQTKLALSGLLGTDAGSACKQKAQFCKQSSGTLVTTNFASTYNCFEEFIKKPVKIIKKEKGTYSTSMTNSSARASKNTNNTMKLEIGRLQDANELGQCAVVNMSSPILMQNLLYRMINDRIPGINIILPGSASASHIEEHWKQQVDRRIYSTTLTGNHISKKTSEQDSDNTNCKNQLQSDNMEAGRHSQTIAVQTDFFSCANYEHGKASVSEPASTRCIQDLIRFFSSAAVKLGHNHNDTSDNSLSASIPSKAFTYTPELCSSRKSSGTQPRKKVTFSEESIQVHLDKNDEMQYITTPIDSDSKGFEIFEENRNIIPRPLRNAHQSHSNPAISDQLQNRQNARISSSHSETKIAKQAGKKTCVDKSQLLGVKSKDQPPPVLKKNRSYGCDHIETSIGTCDKVTKFNADEGIVADINIKASSSYSSTVETNTSVKDIVDKIEINQINLKDLEIVDKCVDTVDFEMGESSTGQTSTHTCKHRYIWMSDSDDASLHSDLGSVYLLDAANEHSSPSNWEQVTSQEKDMSGTHKNNKNKYSKMKGAFQYWLVQSEADEETSNGTKLRLFRRRFSRKSKTKNNTTSDRKLSSASDQSIDEDIKKSKSSSSKLKQSSMSFFRGKKKKKRTKENKPIVSNTSDVDHSKSWSSNIGAKSKNTFETPSGTPRVSKYAEDIQPPVHTENIPVVHTKRGQGIYGNQLGKEALDFIIHSLEGHETTAEECTLLSSALGVHDISDVLKAAIENVAAFQDMCEGCQVLVATKGTSKTICTFQCDSCVSQGQLCYRCHRLGLSSEQWQTTARPCFTCIKRKITCKRSINVYIDGESLELHLQNLAEPYG